MIGIYTGDHKESCVLKNLAGFYQEGLPGIKNKYSCTECSNIFYHEMVEE